MDDEEYYRKLRDRNLNRGFSVAKKRKTAAPGTSSSAAPGARSDFRNWTVTQGREDAEMLYERQHMEED